LNWDDMIRLVKEVDALCEASIFVRHLRKGVQGDHDEENQQIIFRMNILIQVLNFHGFDIQDLLKREELSGMNTRKAHRCHELICELLALNEARKTELLMSPRCQSPLEQVLLSPQKTAQKLSGQSAHPGPQ